MLDNPDDDNRLIKRADLQKLFGGVSADFMRSLEERDARPRELRSEQGEGAQVLPHVSGRPAVQERGAAQPRHPRRQRSTIARLKLRSR